MLLIARGIEGIGSSCINVCGMSLIAHLYPEDQKRSKVMGVILGSIALGVLFGYPLGGFLYDFVSESAPFIIISAFLFTDLAFQLTFFDLTHNEVITPHRYAQAHGIYAHQSILSFSVKSMARKIEEPRRDHRSYCSC